MVKKILPILILVSFLAVLLVPMLASAVVPPETCTLKRDLTDINPACTEGSAVSMEDYGMCCLINTLYSATDWIFMILVALAGIFVVVGAMTLIMAAGEAENVTKGKNYILYAIIGLIVGFLARAIPSIAKIIVGV